MRIFAGVIAGLLFLAVSTQVWAAEVIRLGFFDKQAIVDRSEMGKEGLEKLRAKMVPIREKLDAARQEVEELEEVGEEELELHDLKLEEEEVEDQEQQEEVEEGELDLEEHDELEEEEEEEEAAAAAGKPALAGNSALAPTMVGMACGDLLVVLVLVQGAMLPISPGVPGSQSSSSSTRSIQDEMSESTSDCGTLK